MKRIFLLLAFAACGHSSTLSGDASDCGATGGCPGSDGGHGDDGGGTGSDGSTSGSDGGTGSDGGGSGSDGGMTGMDGGSGMGDGGTSTSCGAPQSPSQTYALSGTAAFGDVRWPRMAYVGGNVYAIGPFSNDTGWYKWAGGGWSFITPPWPSGPKPFIIDIFDLPNTHLVFLVLITYAPNNYDYALIDFDGTSMSAPYMLPAAWRGHARKVTRTPDGVYHVLTYGAPNDPVWAERTSTGNSTWSAASPIAMGQNVDPQRVVLTSLTNSRLALFYTYNHLYEMHRLPNQSWSNAVDLTPQWAIGTQDPVAVGARSGGVAIAITGVGGSYRFPYYFDSTDGITYSQGEYTNPATQMQDQTKFLALDCLAHPVLVIRHQNSIMLLERGMPSAWPAIAAGASYYSAGGTAAVTPDGKTYFGWSYTLDDGSHYTNLLATP